MDKILLYLIPTVIILIVIFYIISLKPQKDTFVTSSQNNKLTYGELIDKLDKKYRLGYKGTYIPVPISEQPIQALPFNPGLKPCELKFTF
jgi:hypothetical protein